VLASRAVLVIIFGSYVGLAITYNLLQPIGEAPDEPAHVSYILYVREHATLPTGAAVPGEPPDPLSPAVAFDQLPLYYVVLALALGPIWLPPGAEVHRNPFIGWPDHPARSANILHRLDEDWPYRGLALLIHLGRLISTVCGLIVLITTYLLVRQVTARPGDAVFATAWLAWTPGFLLASARVNNDAAAMASSALTLLLCTRLLVRPGRVSALMLACLGVALTAALLSKLHALLLVPFVGGAVARAAAGRPWQRAGLAALALAPLVLLGLWWLAYGQTFGRRVGTAAGIGVLAFWHLLSPAALARLPGALWFMNASWWAAIGAPNAAPWPPALYAVLALSTVVLLGAGLWTARHDAKQGRSAAALLSLALLPFLYATIARQALPGTDLDAHGRFLLPTAPILALLVAVGRRSFPAGWCRPVLAVTYPGALLALSIATAFALQSGISRPVIPSRLAGDAAEVAASPIARFASGVDLLTVLHLPVALRPGSRLPLVLRWRTRRTPLRNFTVFTHLLDGSRRRVASSRDEIPFARDFPPVLWQRGEVVDEDQPIEIPRELRPGVYSLRVGLYTHDGGQLTPIPVISGARERTDALVASWPVLPDTSDSAEAHPAGARFGEALILDAYRTVWNSTEFRVILYWHASARLTQDLVISVQVLDDHGRLIAQHDSEPVNGNLPTTAWPIGLTVRDEHVIAMPDAGTADRRTIVVVYNRTAGTRLPVSAPGRPPSDTLPLE
jgi:hypothetical protein